MFPMHVLRADLNVLCPTQRFNHLGKGGEWRYDYHFDCRHVANFQEQIFDELGGLSLQHVHLPVSSDDFFFHKHSLAVIPSGVDGSRGSYLKACPTGFLDSTRDDVTYVLSVNAATPGNSFPSS